MPSFDFRRIMGKYAEAAGLMLKARTMIDEPTVVRLTNGSEFVVRRVLYGRDLGDDYDHITTNLDPSHPGSDVHFFYVTEIEQLKLPSGGAVLFDRKVLAERLRKASEERVDDHRVR
jgi:hypothetical protein